MVQDTLTPPRFMEVNAPAASTEVTSTYGTFLSSSEAEDALTSASMRSVQRAEVEQNSCNIYRVVVLIPPFPHIEREQSGRSAISLSAEVIWTESRNWRFPSVSIAATCSHRSERVVTQRRHAARAYELFATVYCSGCRCAL